MNEQNRARELFNTKFADDNVADLEDDELTVIVGERASFTLVSGQTHDNGISPAQVRLFTFVSVVLDTVYPVIGELRHFAHLVNREIDSGHI